MLNVYIDPTSYVHLNNTYFKEDSKYNTNNCRGPFIFLKKYCREKGISLNTIDLWSLATANTTDIYVSFDHKFLLRKFYWKFKNKDYPITNINDFKKKILFQFELPVVMPEIEVYLKTGSLFKIYDKVLFTSEIRDRRYGYFHTPQAYDGIFSNLWENSDRRFLTMINSNRKSFFRYKELLTERVRAIKFFSQTEDIDLYGFDWEKLPIFPYWLHKGAINKVYKGSLRGSKYKKLSEYSFSLAYENCMMPGYITDKIFDCFFTGTVPIYLGAPDIEKYIPKECFIDMRDFKDYNELKLFLKSLKKSEIQSYKKNARGFLESEQFKPFTKEYFAKVFVDTCLN